MKPVPGLDFGRVFDRAVVKVRRAREFVGTEKGEVLSMGRITCGKPRFPVEYMEVRSMVV
jgi:hypothetical protein